MKSLKGRYLHDPYGRRLSNLRLSVTQRCNFNCFFCHKEGEASEGRELSPIEIEEIVKFACNLGMNKIKLTGGEPLLRDDIVEIVSRIAKYTHDISLTTNGFFLADQARALKEAGLQRVNVSLHSVNPHLFHKITGRNGLRFVKKGIEAALDSHLNPVKINMVILKGINDSEILDMIDSAARQGAILQLIEFQPVHKDNWNPWNKFHYDLKEVEDWLASHAIKSVERELHRRKKYFLPRDGGIASVEVVKPMHNSTFCQNCTRLRVTSTGKLKPCLLRNDNLVDVVSYIRGKMDPEGLQAAFYQALMLREPYWKLDEC